MTIVDFKTLSVYCLRRKCKKLFFQNFTNVQRLQTQDKTLDVVSAQLYHYQCPFNRSGPCCISQGFFLYFPGVNLIAPVLLTAHHIIDLPAKKKVSAVSVFPLCCLNLVCKKATSRIMRVRSLTCLNKHFSTTQTVLGIFCKLGLLAGFPGHSFCNNCSRHPNIEK